MKLNKKGFVMIETIIVISVLSIGLMALYSSYSIILRRTTTKSSYDNAEYIYKTYFINKNLLASYSDYINLPKTLYDYDKKTSTATGYLSNYKELLENMGVSKIYLTTYNVSNINLLIFDGTTINYLRSIKDDTTGFSYRLIVKYKNLNATVSEAQFASIGIK